MSKKFKSQASSSRAITGGGFGGFGLGSASTQLSYLCEPPNLTAITDANVVVAFKNLLKKDSTTKTKGLEDLRSYVQVHPYEQDGGVEDPILEAWVKLYPRISVDNSRRVREISHDLQFELLKSARKRMEKHIPSIVGAWLAGTYDRDRSVARAASDGVKSFLDTDAKVVAFWRRCQAQILSYAKDAIEETPQTLSDERTVSADDMQAKYDRVIGSSLSLVVNLLEKLSKDEVLKHQASYEAILSGNKTLWSFAHSADPFVRRSTSQLLVKVLEKEEGFISADLELLSSFFISEGLRTSQSGSSLQYMQGLCALTAKFPEVWTTSYKGRKGPISKLHHFIERGSQSGPPDFWGLWTSLILNLPSGVLPLNLDGSLELLKSHRDGILSREEVRSNHPAAWNSYIEVVKHLGQGLADPHENSQLLAVSIYPVFEQYIQPSPETSQWTTGNMSALMKAFSICIGVENGETLKPEWQRLAGLVISKMGTSLPEQSKDYTKSQNEVMTSGTRWVNLQAAILQQDTSSSTKEFLVESTATVISRALEIITNRNGKPFGVAATVDAALRLCPFLISYSTGTVDVLSTFFEGHLFKLIMSPSASYLVAALYNFRTLPGQIKRFENAWHTTLDGLLALPQGSQKTAAIGAFLANDASRLAQPDTPLQELLLDDCTKAVTTGGPAEWQLFVTTTTYELLNDESMSKLLSTIIKRLGSRSEDSDSALKALELISQNNPAIIQAEGIHVTLMTRLLALGESSDEETIKRAAALKNIIEAKPGSSSVHSQSKSPLVHIIQDNLLTAGPQSLSIDTLVQQAEEALKNADIQVVVDLLPSVEQWEEALKPLLVQRPNPSIAITNVIGGAVSLTETVDTPGLAKPGRDSNGFSVAFRMALYTSKILAAVLKFPETRCEDFLCLLYLTTELANDQLGLQEENKLWANVDDPDVEEQIQDFLTAAQVHVTMALTGAAEWRDSLGNGKSRLSHRLFIALLTRARGTSVEAFYAGRALSRFLTNTVEIHGWQSSGSEKWLSSPGVLGDWKTTTKDPFVLLAILSGLKEALGSSKLVNTFCNRLVSDIAGAKVDSPTTLKALIFLNTCVSVYDEAEVPVAQNRLIFAIKQITSWMENNKELPGSLAAEATQALLLLYPSISSVYGSHWQSSLEFSINFMSVPTSNETPDQHLAAYYYSIKTYLLCQKFADNADEDERNDDIVEALGTLNTHFPQGLLEIFKLQRKKDNQPWRILDELICRTMYKLPTDAIKELDPKDVYPLLASDFPIVQSGVFDVLKRYTEAHAEQINYDAILEKKDAKLPFELLSLLLGAPTSEKYTDEALLSFPPSIRTYLFSWSLIFSSYQNTSSKVRDDYTQTLKEEDLLTPLLEFIFDILGHSVGKSLNLDRENITSDRIQRYDLQVSSTETPEYDLHWLLVHLYYQALLYLPSLAKNWYTNTKSKQTRLAVESWTEKYFSPLIINSALDEVAKWADAQEPGTDEKALEVKVSRKSREVYAGYEIDDTESVICVKLPAVFPLEGCKVEGVNRVAVGERKWNSWLMICQGAITFSNNDITSGLSTFQKNVTLTLKGQTECAICYSIISSDKKMPDKRCQTCKNLFHSACLFKWFATSNQSTCPLCRNPFGYGGR